jgi:lysophospholipase L1-like esterase
MSLDAATVSVSVSESSTGDEGSTAINLTAEGNLDWGIWQTDNRTPTNRMIDGTGFSDLSLIAGAADFEWLFHNPENAYSWTNGTPLEIGENETEAARATLTDNGDGVRLTINVGDAGNYQLKFYTTTSGVLLDGTASLVTGGVSDTAIGVTYNGLAKFEYTVDFTTDGADTLTLDVVKSSGDNTIFAFEAFTLSVIGSDPTLSTYTEMRYNGDGSQQSFQIPYSNEGGGDDLIITSVTPSGEDAAYFSVDSFSTPLAIGDTGNIGFILDPTDGERVYRTTFMIASNDPEAPSTAVEVTVLSSTVDLGKILCIGDSITEANGDRPMDDGSWSWRYPFWKDMVDYAVGNEFVGTRTSNHNSASVYPDYKGESFLNRHEAQWGIWASNRAAAAPTYLGTLKSQDNTPDTAIVFCGSNDVDSLEDGTAQTIADRIKVIVDNLQGDVGVSGNANIRILLVSTLPRGRHSTFGDQLDELNAVYAEINTLMEAMTETETTETSQVIYVDAYSSFFDRYEELFWDKVHPNGVGEKVLGDLIFEVLVTDRDTDGMSDMWELEYFNSLATANPTDDEDGDGVNNLDEFVYGQSPVMSDAAPYLNLSLENSQLSFSLPVASGTGYEYLERKYTLYSSLNLVKWDPEQTGVADGNPVIVSLDFSEPSKFYKLGIRIE